MHRQAIFRKLNFENDSKNIRMYTFEQVLLLDDIKNLTKVYYFHIQRTGRRFFIKNDQIISDEMTMAILDLNSSQVFINLRKIIWKFDLLNYFLNSSHYQTNQKFYDLNNLLFHYFMDETNIDIESFVELLVKQENCDINFDNNSILYHLISINCLDKVLIALKFGSNIFIPDKKFNLPAFEFAKKFKRNEILKLF